MIFETTENVTRAALRELGNDAFSDYVLPAPPMPQAAFDDMLLQRGFDPALSWIAREGDMLAAYWFVGTEPDAQPKLSYGLSVGTRPRFRRQGLSMTLWQHASAALKAAGYSEHILEVTETNDRAVALYERLGFSKARRVACFKGPAPVEAKTPFRIEQTRIEVALAIGKTLREWAPTWQNAEPAVRNLANTMAASVVYDGDRPIGYGIFHTPYGQVVQIAVHPNYRRQGIATAVIASWARTFGNEVMGTLNVPDADNASLPFYRALGWENHVNQFELVATL